MELNEAIEQLESRLRRTQRQAEDLLGDAGRARVEAELQREKLERARWQLESTRQAIAASEGEIVLLTAEIEELRDRLSRGLRALYRFGRFAYLRVLFSLQPDRPVVPAFRQLRHLTQRDAANLAHLRESQRRLREERELLDQQQQRLVGLVDLEREEASRLDRRERELARLARELEARRESIRARVDAQRQRFQRLTRLMEILADEGASGLLEEPIQEFRGSLDWPVDGEVRTGFGLRQDPKYGTTVPHNGVELVTREQVEVRVVYPGRVIFAAPFQDLGYTVVVQHETAVLTLYAGLAELSATEGDVLALGDSVGLSEERLYFELRHQRRPEDPLNWLR